MGNQTRQIAFTFADTEDNSPELLAAGRSGFEKEITQAAALGSDGERFHASGARSGEKFLQWLESRPCRVCYFHNLSYDLGNLFGDDLLALDMLLVGGRIISARWRGVLFLDSFNIWPMPLAKMGEAFGLVKGKLNVRSADYVFRDCEIGLAAMRFAHEFASRFRVEKLPNTLGGLCVAVYKAMGLKNCHDASHIARAGYYGGRVELFNVGGTGRIAYTDINSLYPWAMTQPFPADAGTQKQMRGDGVAHVRIRVPAGERFAPLPLRRADGTIVYPVGTFRGVWTYAEIRAAVERGARVEKVFECYGSTKRQKFYAPFVERLYRERLRAETPAEKLMLKLLMNNLYGRLAIRGSVTRITKGVTRQIRFPLPEFSNVLHGAHVTGFGRLRLAEFFPKVGDNLIYCDTDSLFFFCKGRLPFKVGTALGGMKLEAWGASCIPKAPKVYQFGDEYKAKGIPRHAAKQFFQEGWAEYDAPFKTREALKFFDAGNSRKLSVWRRVRKERRTEYDKKRLQGGEFFPIVAGETNKAA